MDKATYFLTPKSHWSAGQKTPPKRSGAALAPPQLPSTRRGAAAAAVIDSAIMENVPDNWEDAEAGDAMSKRRAI